MLERPDIKDEQVSAVLRQEYDLPDAQIVFLPLGADASTAVFRIETGPGEPFLLKLRRGPFDEAAVALPKFLHDQGIDAIIPPLATRTGRLWSELGPYRAILYPFIYGRNAYAARLSAGDWRAFAAALRRIHTAVLPPALAACLRREQFTPAFRRRARFFLDHVQGEVLDDPVAQEVAALLREQRAVVLALITRAAALARELQERPLPYVVCHSDLHAGNLLLADSGALYLVDWDEPILAPRERDLMYVGGGLLASGLDPQQEEERFYAVYGRSGVNARALSYYRYERIVQDIVAFCEELLLTAVGGADRAQSLHYLRSNFLPQGTIAIARDRDQSPNR